MKKIIDRDCYDLKQLGYGYLVVLIREKLDELGLDSNNQQVLITVELEYLPTSEGDNE